MPDQTAIAPLDVIGLVRLVWHGKLIIVAAIAAMTLLGGYYAFYMTQPKFAATATLQTNPQPANLRDVSNHWPNPATDAASLNTQVTILTSDRILEQVIGQLGLLNDPEFNRYLNPTSPLSMTALRGRVRDFLNGTTGAAPDSQAIAEKTVQNLRGALSAIQPRDTYIFQITARSRDPEKAALVANAAAAAYITSQIEAKEDDANADIQWLSTRVATLRRQLERQEHAVTQQIAQAQIQEETMLDALSSAVLSVDEERATTLAALAGYDSSAASLRQTAEIAQLQDQLGEIDARRTRLRGQLVTQSEGLGVLQQMQREADATRVLYQSFLARLQETQVQRGLDFPDSRIIAPATTGRYIGPRKVLLLQSSLVLGGLLGLALVAAQHLGRTGIYHPDQLRQTLGRPVYAALPATTTRNRNKLLRFLRTTDGQAISRNMRSSLMLASDSQLPQVITVTSATSGEGKAGFATALAYSLSSKGPTLIIDANTNATPLLRPSQIPAQDPQLGLDTLRLANADTLLAPDYLSDIKGRYAHIVIITAPISGNAEAQLLTRHADAAVLTVRWARTLKAQALHALALCEEATDAPIGLALMKTQPSKMKRLAKIIAPQAAWQTSRAKKMGPRNAQPRSKP